MKSLETRWMAGLAQFIFCPPLPRGFSDDFLKCTGKSEKVRITDHSAYIADIRICGFHKLAGFAHAVTNEKILRAGLQFVFKDFSEVAAV